MGYKSKFKGAEIDAHLEKMVNVTYAELKALRDEGKLIAGQMYRMTDYETTCTWENTQVAGHPFDLVLTALDNKTLDEKCSAIQSARDKDGYFANSNLAAWDVRYCLDNDTERFVWENEDYEYETWADTNGKGVIYRLTDENDNCVPYDFKNIMFMRPLTSGKYDEENGVDTYCYTFCCIDENTFKIEDQSVKEPLVCYDNRFADFCHNNVFLTFSEYYCISNHLAPLCYSNTFGSDCYCNTLGCNSESNIFGGDFHYSTLGEGCDSNVFGEGCVNIVLGSGCYSVTLPDYCNSIVLGDNCYDVRFINEETASYYEEVAYYEISRVCGSDIQVYRIRNYQTFITWDKSGNIVEYTVDDIINK